MAYAKLLSIHSPLAGRDCSSMRLYASRAAFQSTRPLRGETKRAEGRTPQMKLSIHSPLAGRDDDSMGEYDSEVLSIHSPLAGRDGPGIVVSPHIAAFNPLAPCGARRSETLNGASPYPFQSTRPLRGETFLDALVFQT